VEVVAPSTVQVVGVDGGSVDVAIAEVPFIVLKPGSSCNVTHFNVFTSSQIRCLAKLQLLNLISVAKTAPLKPTPITPFKKRIINISKQK